MPPEHPFRVLASLSEHSADLAPPGVGPAWRPSGQWGGGGGLPAGGAHSFIRLPCACLTRGPGLLVVTACWPSAQCPAGRGPGSLLWAVVRSPGSGPSLVSGCPGPLALPAGLWAPGLLMSTWPAGRGTGVERESLWEVTPSFPGAGFCRTCLASAPASCRPAAPRRQAS